MLQTTGEKQAQEVRKLKQELGIAEEKINSLTTQLSTNVILSLSLLYFCHAGSPWR